MSSQESQENPVPFSARFSELALVWALAFIPLALIGLERFIARDEGFYLYAGQLVAAGEVPYLDFFYPQMPLLPYFFAPLSFSWEASRLLMAATAATTATLLYAFSPGRFLGCFGLILFISCHFIFAWHTTVQTYAPATLFLFAACCALRGKGAYAPFWCGLFFGLACGVRLYLGPLVVVFLFWMLLFQNAEVRWRSIRRFFAGASLIALPVALFLYLDPLAFYFNNLGYHFDRSARPDALEWNKKRIVLMIALGLRETQKFDAPQLALLLWGTTFFTLGGLLKRRLPSVFFVAAVLIAIISLAPNPTYVQYFALLPPFLILALLEGFASTEMLKRRAVSVCFALVFVAGYWAGIHRDIDRYVLSAEGVIGIPQAKRGDWKLGALREVQAILNQSEIEGEVLVFWPGYLIGTPLRALSGLENQFSLLAARRVENPGRYRLASRDDLRHAVESERLGALVLYETALANRRKLRQIVESSGYRVQEQVGGVQIYLPASKNGNESE